jgi:D-alanine transaminase
MSAPLPTCLLNGAFMPLEQARVSPLDRGFLFADAVYEVVPVYGGRPFRLREHLQRLDRSLDAIRMAPVMTHEAWAELLVGLISRNSAHDASLYLQVTRGAEQGRNHAWPPGLTPTIFAYCTELPPMPAALLESGVAAVTAEDIRWARRDIKSTALLGNILLKKLAADAGAFETIMLENGELTEGSSTTVHVIKHGVICTPPNGRRILPGTTRDVVTQLADRLGLSTASMPISEAELRGADEIWLAFATRGLLPVTTLDGEPVGAARAAGAPPFAGRTAGGPPFAGRPSPGPYFVRVYQAFQDYIAELAGTPPL